MSLPFLLNHIQRSLTSLLLRVILAHTLAKISDEAGAFILLSLVSATQRRRQLLRGSRYLVADAMRQKCEPGFRLTVAQG